MIVGIDLGTTNSLIGVWRNGEAVLIPNALGSFLTPSVVGTDEEGRVLVGQAARDRLVTHPGSTAAAFKRHMGTDKQIRVGSRNYRAEELSALVLQSLKADAEAFLGEPVTEAVITVPAYFNDTQRKATKAAGQLAGLKVDRLLTEPTAAALAYGFVAGDDDATILVIDLGGGTLDVSLLHAFEGIIEVKATAGDIWFGGEDFTDAIAATFMAEAGKAAGMPPFAENLPVHGAIRRQAEVAKRALSDADSATMDVVFNGKSVSWTLARERFESISEPLLARIRLPLERALRDARMPPDAIDRVIFAGGAARMPMFRRLISRLLRQLPIQTINPDEVVARGAAVRAGLASKAAGLEERVLTDVSPFTLGVEIAERGANGVLLHGMFLPIIERNTVVPASRSHSLSTIVDKQTRVDVRVFQGESRVVSDNVFLGKLTASVPPAPAGKESIEVRFSYDTSGLLEVEVTTVSTRKTERVVIEGNPGVLNKEEIRVRLEALQKLKVHPRDDAANVAVVERCKRLYEENLGDLRLVIAEHLTQMLSVLERQDPQEIATARERLSAFLDSIDRSVLI
ncbi:MAG TPA: molecular chaperone HscC [Rhizomicrobium sp.]|jgi:molecular chaperone HscC|nr:molecular chaperone HscC [Rhizomicrobium sp.]